MFRSSPRGRSRPKVIRPPPPLTRHASYEGGESPLLVKLARKGRSRGRPASTAMQGARICSRSLIFRQRLISCATLVAFSFADWALVSCQQSARSSGGSCSHYGHGLAAYKSSGRGLFATCPGSHSATTVASALKRSPWVMLLGACSCRQVGYVTRAQGEADFAET